mmetsp:Transcript_98973/g.227327  ORF Transcript_98973/g.227327 Transcript_98973/m.227327 type:complete len:136 (+) Transcript_98973:180-587(+)
MCGGVVPAQGVISFRSCGKCGIGKWPVLSKWTKIGTRPTSGRLSRKNVLQRWPRLKQELQKKREQRQRKKDAKKQKIAVAKGRTDGINTFAPDGSFLREAAELLAKEAEERKNIVDQPSVAQMSSQANITIRDES